MQKVESLVDVIALLYKHKKRIIVITAIAGVLSALISLTLPNYFRATTTFYAASPDLAKPERIFGYSSYDMNYYGSGLDIDRLMTIAFSNELAEYLIDSFDLYKHYDIDPDGPKARFKIREELSGLYEVLKTKYDALELSIEDKDRDMAAQMANASRNKINELAQNVIKGSQEKIILAFKESIKEKEKSLEQISDSLQTVRRKYGIFNTESQAEILAGILGSTESALVREKERLDNLVKSGRVPRDTINYLRAKVKGLEKEYKSIVDSNSTSRFTLTKFNEGKGVVEALEQLYGQTHKQISYDKIRLEQLITTYESDVTTIHLVEKAEVPEVKSRPKRSVLVLASAFVAFVLTCLVILLMETFKSNNWRHVLRS